MTRVLSAAGAVDLDQIGFESSVDLSVSAVRDREQQAGIRARAEQAERRAGWLERKARRLPVGNGKRKATRQAAALRSYVAAVTAGGS